MARLSSGVCPGTPAFMGGAVFLPQQHQCDALAAQLDVHAGEVGFDHLGLGDAAPEQPAFQAGLVEFCHGGPVQASCAGQAEVLGDDALEMPRLREMAACDSAALYLSLRMSLTMRMSIRCCGICAQAKRP